MWIGIVIVVVVAVLAAAALVFRRAQDDEHSVEHYHRQLHTLEEIRGHPAAGDETGAPLPGAEEHANGGVAAPASAFRVSGTRTVRLTDLDTPTVPPAPPTAVPNPAEPVTFDDTGTATVSSNGAGGESFDEGRTSFMRGDDKAMHSIDHRPRRLGAPLAAIGVVTVLIIVLIVTGLHSTTPPAHGNHGSSSSVTSTTVHSGSHASTTVPTHAGTGAGRGRHGRTTTTTTATTVAPPAVSAPTAATAHAATYDVAANAYALSLAASNGACWVEAENPATGSVLFTGTLTAGQSHIVSATGSVVVIAGAPGAFAATVNGAPVALPPGAQAPFTLTFQPPAGTGAGSSATTTPTS